MVQPRYLAYLAAALATLGVLFACCSASGQEIVGPPEFAEHDLADYRVAFDRAEGERVIAFWEVPAPLAYRELGPDGDSLHLTGPPGSYTLRVRLLVGRTFEDARRLSAATSVVVTPAGPPPTPPGPNPDPPRPPGPAPGPTPVVSGTLWVHLVFDDVRLTPAVAGLVSSGTILGEVRVRGGRLRRVEVDSAEFAEWTGGRPLRDLIPANMVGDLPLLIFQDGDTGKIVATARPGTAEELLRAVDNLRGNR